MDSHGLAFISLFLLVKLQHLVLTLLSLATHQTLATDPLLHSLYGALTIRPFIHSAFNYFSLSSFNSMADHLRAKAGSVSVVCPAGWSDEQREFLGQ